MNNWTFTDADEARVQAMIASDPDAPEAADEQLAAARPFAEAFPALKRAHTRFIDKQLIEYR